jgi:hypothetical protein
LSTLTLLLQSSTGFVGACVARVAAARAPLPRALPPLAAALGYTRDAGEPWGGCLVLRYWSRLRPGRVAGTWGAAEVILRAHPAAPVPLSALERMGHRLLPHSLRVSSPAGLLLFDMSPGALAAPAAARERAPRPPIGMCRRPPVAASARPLFYSRLRIFPLWRSVFVSSALLELRSCKRGPPLPLSSVAACSRSRWPRPAPRRAARARVFSTPACKASSPGEPVCWVSSLSRPLASADPAAAAAHAAHRRAFHRGRRPRARQRARRPLYSCSQGFFSGSTLVPSVLF